MIELVDEGTTCKSPLLLYSLAVKQFFKCIFTIALLGLWMGGSSTNYFDAAHENSEMKREIGGHAVGGRALESGQKPAKRRPHRANESEDGFVIIRNGLQGAIV
ncbi:MAG: hypothetical protein WCF26_22605 [Candidatus Sulfotelmatobacter sp.]